MLDIVKMDVTRILMSVRIQSEEEVREAALAIEERAEQIGNVTYTHPNDDGSVSEDRSSSESAAAQAALGAVAAAMASSRSALPGGVPKVGRNEPCPCGSGKKYKQCHGRLA
jgi:preprotein translocase subunit SecA